MKKLLAIALVLAMVLSLWGCGKSAPAMMSDTTFQLGCDGLKLMDKHLDHPMDPDKLGEKMAPILEKLDEETTRLNDELDTLTIDYNKEEDIEKAMMPITAMNAWFLMNHFVIGAFNESGIGDEGYDCQELRDQMFELLYPEP